MRTPEDIFKQKTEIPAVVQRRLDTAFSSIKMEGVKMKKKKKSFFKRPVAVIAAAAAVVLAAGTALAAANGFWSQGAKGMIQADGTWQQQLVDIGTATVFDTSYAVTKDGITITPKEMIADKRGLKMTFMITGIEDSILKEDSEYIQFVNIDSEIEGLNGNFSFDGHFYTEHTFADDGTLETNSLVYEDDEPALEYIVHFDMNGSDISPIGKTVHLTFDGLGMAYGKAGDVENFISESTWEFDIPVNVADSSVIFDVSQLIYEPYTVTSIEISPLSMQVNYDVDGQVEISDDLNAPVLYGLKMKDGTIIDLHSELEDGTPVFFRDLGRCTYDNGLPYTMDEDERLFPVSAYSTATFNTVIDPAEIAEVILQPWGEAYPWMNLPEEIIAEEYGGEIPFELIDPDNIEKYYISLNK